MVYFIKESSGFVKIGFATTETQFKSRLGAARTFCPTEITATYLVEGSRALESKIHDRFCQQRYRAEWFRWDSNIEAYIQTEATHHFPGGTRSMTHKERDSFLEVTNRHLDHPHAIILRVMFHARLTPRQVHKVEIKNGEVILSGKTLELPHNVLSAVINLGRNELVPFTERQLRRIWNEYRPSKELGLFALSNWS